MIQKDKNSFNPEKTVRRLIDFIRDELNKTGVSRLVLGVSGGLDSALVLRLAVQSAGEDNVIGVIMPYKTSNAENIADAGELISEAGVKSYQVDITSAVDSYFELFPDADTVRRGNKMARERMSVLYDISAAENAVVIGTSNKSEMLLGYGTIYGDLACAFNPLGDIYKTEVRLLARYLGIPEKIITKAPSADLFAGQSDESDFGFTYENVDKLLGLLVDKGMTPAQCLDAGFERSMVTKTVKMIANNEFKRFPPAIASLSDNPLGIQFRHPREWGDDG